MVEQALKAITELDRVGALAFITCESGPETKPQVVAKFRHIQDAQEYHRALVECGTVARLIELDCGVVAELIAAAKDIRDNPGTDAHGSVGFCAIELPKLDRLRDALAAIDSSR
jgi:hypothetical protein